MKEGMVTCTPPPEFSTVALKLYMLGKSAFLSKKETEVNSILKAGLVDMKAGL